MLFCILEFKWHCYHLSCESCILSKINNGFSGAWRGCKVPVKWLWVIEVQPWFLGILQRSPWKGQKGHWESFQILEIVRIPNNKSICSWTGAKDPWEVPAILEGVSWVMERGFFQLRYEPINTQFPHTTSNNLSPHLAIGVRACLCVCVCLNSTQLNFIYKAL